MMETNWTAVYITVDLLPEPEIEEETERKRGREIKRETLRDTREERLWKVSRSVSGEKSSPGRLRW